MSLVVVEGAVKSRIVDPVPNNWVPVAEVGRLVQHFVRIRVHGLGVDANGVPFALSRVDGRPLRFVATGRLRDSFETIAGTERATVTYGGQHSPRITNAALASILFSRATRDPFELNASERDAVRKTVAVAFQRTMLGSATDTDPRARRLVTTGVVVR